MPEPIILHDKPVAKIKRGRRLGSGKNMNLLRELAAGSMTSCIFNVRKRKMQSLRYSAFKAKIPIIIREIKPGFYCIWKGRS